MTPSELLPYVAPVIAFLGGTGFGGFFVKRFYDKRDKEEDRRVAAYREVLTAVGSLRATGNQLHLIHDWNQGPPQAELTATVAEIATVWKLVEKNREDTGHAFADAAKAVAKHWDQVTNAIDQGDYNYTYVGERLPEAETKMYEAIPKPFRSRVAPGHFEELAAKAKQRPDIAKTITTVERITAQVEATAKQAQLATEQLRSLPSGSLLDQFAPAPVSEDRSTNEPLPDAKKKDAVKG